MHNYVKIHYDIKGRSGTITVFRSSQYKILLNIPNQIRRPFLSILETTPPENILLKKL